MLGAHTACYAPRALGFDRYDSNRMRLFMSSFQAGLTGDALAEKIVEMHESCSGGVTADRDSAALCGGVPGTGGAGAGLGSSVTPLEYISFLHSWLDMHESKKVIALNLAPFVRERPRDLSQRARLQVTVCSVDCS